MAVKINSRHGKLSDNTKEHIEKACAKLHQFFDRIIDCEVVIDTKKEAWDACGDHRQGTQPDFGRKS